MSEWHKDDKWDNSLSNAFGEFIALLSGAIAIGVLVALLLYPV